MDIHTSPTLGCLLCTQSVLLTCCSPELCSPCLGSYRCVSSYAAAQPSTYFTMSISREGKPVFPGEVSELDWTSKATSRSLQGSAWPIIASSHNSPALSPLSSQAELPNQAASLSKPTTQSTACPKKSCRSAIPTTRRRHAGRKLDTLFCSRQGLLCSTAINHL